MSGERPGAAELVAAGAAEAIALAGEVGGLMRKRLQVLAYTLALAARDQAAPGMADGEDTDLTAALRAGAHDGALDTIADRLEHGARERAEVVNPGYTQN